MEEVKIQTGVDALISFLEEKDKVTIKEISEKLKIPQTTIQLWVDFLVEEEILGVEYKFTTPHIFLNKKTQKFKLSHQLDEEIKLSDFRKEFFQKAKEDKIPPEEILTLWENHLLNAIEKEKDFFKKEAFNRNIQHINQLFERYKQKTMSL